MDRHAVDAAAVAAAGVEVEPTVENQGVVPVTAPAGASVPGTAVQAIEVPAPAVKSGWQVVGAVVRGVSHERLGMPCQDAQDYRVLPDGTLLIAVADGAGSAPFSDQGARCAVNQALDSLSTALEAGQPRESEGWAALLSEVFDSARAAVIWLAATNAAEGQAPGIPVGEPAEDAQEASDAREEQPPLERAYATTLTCAIATADRLIVGQIGDGMVVAGEGERLFSVTRLQRGEYANETHFLTQPGALEQLLVEVIEQPVRELAVMSDGLIRLALKMPEQEPHAPFFRPFFRVTSMIGQPGGAPDENEAARQLVAFLASERVNARTDDDKSLVLAVRVESQRESGVRAQAEDRTMVEDASGSRNSTRKRDAEKTPRQLDREER